MANLIVLALLLIGAGAWSGFLADVFGVRGWIFAHHRLRSGHNYRRSSSAVTVTRVTMTLPCGM